MTEGKKMFWIDSRKGRQEVIEVVLLDRFYEDCAYIERKVIRPDIFHDLHDGENGEPGPIFEVETIREVVDGPFHNTELEAYLEMADHLLETISDANRRYIDCFNAIEKLVAARLKEIQKP